jgi:hypothetical protein
MAAQAMATEATAVRKRSMGSPNRFLVSLPS